MDLPTEQRGSERAVAEAGPDRHGRVHGDEHRRYCKSASHGHDHGCERCTGGNRHDSAGRRGYGAHGYAARGY